MDQIIIRDLVVHGILGVNPEERTQTQPILINIALDYDTRAAAQSDDLTQTVSYSRVARRVRQHVEQSRDRLVEKLVADLACLILTEFPVEAVRVRVEKPTAVRNTAAVGVEIARTRADLGLPPATADPAP